MKDDLSPLIQEAEPQWISEALTKTYKDEDDDCTGFQMLCMSPKELKSALDKASPQSINQALQADLAHGHAVIQPLLVWNVLAAKASVESITQWLIANNGEGFLSLLRMKKTPIIDLLIAKVPLVIRRLPALSIQRILTLNKNLNDSERLRVREHLEIIRNPRAMILSNPNAVVAFFRFYLLDKNKKLFNLKDWLALLEEVINLTNANQAQIKDSLLEFAVIKCLEHYKGADPDGKIKHYLLQVSSFQQWGPKECVFWGNHCMYLSRHAADLKEKVDFMSRALDCYERAITSYDEQDYSIMQTQLKSITNGDACEYRPEIKESPALPKKGSLEEEKEGISSQEKAKKVIQQDLAKASIFTILDEFEIQLKQRKKGAGEWFSWLRSSAVDCKIINRIFDELQYGVRNMKCLETDERINDLKIALKDYLSNDRIINGWGNQAAVIFLKRMQDQLAKLEPKSNNALGLRS